MKKYLSRLILITSFFIVFFLASMGVYAGTPAYITNNLTLSADTTYDDLYLQGGTLDLNGKTMTVTGKLIQSSGILKVNGGRVNVTGDYRIQTESGTFPNYTYSNSSGYLLTTNSADYVQVDGIFATQGVANSSSPVYLTAGILEVKGDFVQKLVAR